MAFAWYSAEASSAACSGAAEWLAAGGCDSGGDSVAVVFGEDVCECGVGSSCYCCSPWRGLADGVVASGVVAAVSVAFSGWTAGSLEYL